MLFLGGVALAFFLTILLVSKSNKTIADKILTGWLFILNIHLLLFYFAKLWLYPQLLGALMPLPLMHGPLLFLYTLALTKGNLSVRRSLLHFIPSTAILIYLVPFFALPLEQRIQVFKNNGAGYEVFNTVRLVAIIVSGVAYVLLSSISLRRHRNLIGHEFSSTDKINLDWLQYLIYWIGAIWILVIIGNDDWTFAATVLFISFIGFFGIRQVGIFNTPVIAVTHDKHVIRTLIIEESESNLAEETPEKAKYQKSGLSHDSSESLHKNLSLIMTDEKVFRESELSLTALASLLNTQPNYLSQVINEREGKNFYDYINTMRIEEFKRLARNSDSRKYTLLGLAQECGFNSKSSFNRYFKKCTGQSPSEFIDSVSGSRN